jgi:hypothetical protein
MDFKKRFPLCNVTKICLVGTEFVCADGHIGTSCDYSDVHKT